MMDAINASFELAAVFFVCLNIRALKRDRQIRGVSLVAMMFFTTWGYWNIIYYPHLDQIMSAIAGVLVAFTNSCYFVLYWKIRSENKELQ